MVDDRRQDIAEILIADDDPDFRRLLVRRAERMGLTIEEAKDGKQAMEMVRSHRFDVLVLDLYMPGHSGLEVFHAARRLDPDVQSIVLTGNATIETAVDALRAGAYDYMLKPLESLAVFELSLSRAMEHRLLLRENARLFAEVERLAMTDPLTGLYNRHKLNESLDLEVERGRRYSRPLSAIMIDLDNLKEVNDRFGHLAGDDVLIEVADGIRSQIRRVDIPTRFGGDEFLILLPEADIAEAKQVADRICEHIGGIYYGDSESVSASLGVVEMPYEPELTAERFLALVDEALYQAKRSGGGCIHSLNHHPNGH